MITFAIALIIISLGVLLGFSGFPLIGFITVVIGGLLPFVYEPIKSLWK